MAGYDYSTYVTDIGSLLEVPVIDATLAAPFVDPSYNNWLPRAIEAGEQRIYRELDLLGTRTVDATGSLTANQRRFTLPTSVGAFIVVEEVAVFSPAGTRVQLLPVSKEYLDACWPTDTAAFTPSVPSVWCPFNQSSIFVGPSPGSNYSMEIVGTIRPAPLSSTNTTTVLTTYCPDAFLMASAISFLGFQRDFGQASSDPAMAQSWEAQYQIAMKSAAVEQFRVRFASQGWGCRLPSPVASPPQT